MASTINDQDAYARDSEFWKNYVQGRPQVPKALFDRISEYHASHGGNFGVVHDVGAGVGVHSPQLRQHFEQVIISDIVEKNIEIARTRLGTHGYSYRAKSIEEADDLEPGSVDMVYASAMMHFADLPCAYEAIARQLRSGGTLVILACGRHTLQDARAQEVWMQMWHEGCRITLERSSDRQKNVRRLGRVHYGYDSIELDSRVLLPGALRIRLNETEWDATMPDVIVSEYTQAYGGSAIKPDEQILNITEPGWSVKMTMESLRQTFATYAFASLAPEAYEPFWKRLEDIVGEREIDAVCPARLVLATRR